MNQLYAVKRQPKLIKKFLHATKCNFKVTMDVQKNLEKEFMMLKEVAMKSN